MVGSTTATLDSGGPEGIRTPDLLNAICRAGVHWSPVGPRPYSIQCAIVLRHPRESPAIHPGLLSDVLSESVPTNHRTNYSSPCPNLARPGGDVSAASGRRTRSTGTFRPRRQIPSIGHRDCGRAGW